MIYKENSVISLDYPKDVNFRKHSNDQFFFLLSAVILVNFGLGISLPVFPEILFAINLGKSSNLGLILVTFSIGQVFFSPIIGYLSDIEYMPKVILQFSFISFLMSNLIFPFYLDNMNIIVLIRIFQGISVAGILPISLIITNAITETKNLSRKYSLIFSGINFGWMFGSIFGGFLYEKGGFILPFLISGISSFIGFIFVSLLKSKPIKTDIDSMNIEIRSSINLKSKKSVSYGIVIFITLLYVIFIDSWAWSLINPGLAFFSLKTIKITLFEYGLFLGYFNFVIFVGQIILSQFYQYNKEKMIFIAGILHFIGYGSLIFASSFIDLLIMATITGVGMSVLLPSVSLYINDISAEKNLGFNLSFLTTITQIAGIIGLILGGFLGDFISFFYLLLISALSLLSVSIIILILNLCTRRISDRLYS